MLGKGRKEKDQTKINLTLIDQQVIQQDWDDREFIEVTHQFFFAYFFHDFSNIIAVLCRVLI